MKIKTILIICLLLSASLISSEQKHEAIKSEFLYRITVNIANVRFNPDIKSRVTGRLRKNLLIKISEIKGEWAKVALDGFYFRKEREGRPWGFIHKSLIEKTAKRPQDFTGLGSVQVRFASVNIREKATVKSRVTGTTSAGVIFTVLKKADNWVTVLIPEIKDNKIRRGFIYAPLLKSTDTKPFDYKAEDAVIKKASDNIIIQGDITEDITLKGEKSYLFKGRVKINKGVKFITEPGTELIFEKCTILSEDKLKFAGSYKAPLLISAKSENNQDSGLSEISSPHIVFDKCLIFNDLSLKCDKKCKTEVLNSEINGSISFSGQKSIKIDSSVIKNSLKGFIFENSKDISVYNSLFLNNKSALRFIKSSGISVKFNTFYNNAITLESDSATDLSDNFWYSESLDRIMNSVKCIRGVIIEPRLMLPTEKSPSQIYEHIVYPEEAEKSETVELEMLFNRDMSNSSIPLIEISSEKASQSEKAAIQNIEWITPRRLIAVVTLPSDIKPGSYKFSCSNISSKKSFAPLMIKNPQIKILTPCSVTLLKTMEQDDSFLDIRIKGKRICNILLYRQTEKSGYNLFKKWKNNANLRSIRIKATPAAGERWADYEVIATDDKGKILTKSAFIRIDY